MANVTRGQAVKLSRYDATVQWTDGSREPGYRETIEDLVVEAESPSGALQLARSIRPGTTRAQVTGVTGTAIAVQGTADVWSKS